MAQLNSSLLLLFLSIFSVIGVVEPSVHRQSRAQAYIVAQCRSTRYFELCVKCLSDHVSETAQSPHQLAQIALKVSLTRAQYTSAYVTKVVQRLKKTRAKEYQSVKDCLYQINDGVDQLTQSLKELQRMGRVEGDDFLWHESNIQTWVSTALTDATSCINGFSKRGFGGKLRATIKAKVLNVAQVTSNALALFNRFAARHRQRVTGASHNP